MLDPIRRRLNILRRQSGAAHRVARRLGLRRPHDPGRRRRRQRGRARPGRPGRPGPVPPTRRVHAGRGRPAPTPPPPAGADPELFATADPADVDPTATAAAAGGEEESPSEEAGRQSDHAHDPVRSRRPVPRCGPGRRAVRDRRVRPGPGLRRPGSHRHREPLHHRDPHQSQSAGRRLPPRAPPQHLPALRPRLLVPHLRGRGLLITRRTPIRPPPRLRQDPLHRLRPPRPAMRTPPPQKNPPRLGPGRRHRQTGLRPTRRSPPPPPTQPPPALPP